MKNYKLIAILLGLVILVNYNNFLSYDKEKLYDKINLLEKKIAKEELLNNINIDNNITVEGYSRYFYDGDKLNYSQAMTAFQNIIVESANGACEVELISWAQVPEIGNEYDKLKMNVDLLCFPGKIFTFINRLRGKNKLIIAKYLKVFKRHKEDKLMIKLQLEAYRIKSEEEI